MLALRVISTIILGLMIISFSFMIFSAFKETYFHNTEEKQTCILLLGIELALIFILAVIWIL